MKLIYSIFFLATWMHLECSALGEPAHPILAIEGSGSGANAILSSWTESEYINKFTPRYAPRDYQVAQVPLVVPGDTSWSWSISNPDKVTSLPSGTLFPNNTYTVQTQAVTVMSGKTVNAPYYMAAAGSTTKTSLVFNLIAYYQRAQLRRDFANLSAAYVNSGTNPATRNDAYARRIAVALLAWAEYFPDYTATVQNKSTFIDTGPAYILSSTAVQRASDHNGLAHEWSEAELLAFDAIYDSTALTSLSAERGFDVRGYIKTNYFFFGGDYFVDHVPIEVAIAGNLSAPFSVLAKVARVLNRPDYLEWMGEYFNATLQEKINRDGVLDEGLSYSFLYLDENSSGLQNVGDYFLTWPADTPELVTISNNIERYTATLARGLQNLGAIALPNGQQTVCGDTGFNFSFAARNAGNSALLPAYGALSLGTGSTASNAVQLNQSFCGDNNHMHSDTTAFTLWAFGNEYLGNLRYHNATAGRTFNNQLLAHNAVVIDRTGMVHPPGNTYGDGDLTLYEGGNNGLALTEIDGQRAYSNKASRYQRIMLLNTHDLAKPYVVDVLRVTGGQTHDYTFHGSIRYDSSWECSFALSTNFSAYPMLENGEVWVEPATAYSTFPYYGFWRNVSSNQAPGDFQITYRDASSSNLDVRLWMTDDGTADVYVGRTPVAGRDSVAPVNVWVNNLWRPSSIIRRRISSGTLESLFVSVIEPMNNGVSSITKVERLPMIGGGSESCALRVTFTDGREDTCVINLHNPAVAGAGGGSQTVFTLDGEYLLNGRIGVQSDDGSSGSRVWTVGANNFEYSGRQFRPSRVAYSGVIDGETRKLTGAGYDAFMTTTPLPLGTALQGQQLSLNFGPLSGEGTDTISEMFEIDQVVFTNGQYYICLATDHGLEISDSAAMVEQLAPRRTFTGSNSFEIVQSASELAPTVAPAILLADDLSVMDHFTNTSYVTASAWSTDGDNAVYIHQGSGSGRARLESISTFDLSAYTNGSVTLEFISTVSDLRTRLEVGLLDAMNISSYDQPLGRRNIFGFSVCLTDGWNLPGLLYNGEVGAPYPSVTNVIDGVRMTAMNGTHLYKVVFRPSGTELFRDGTFLGSTTHVLDFSRAYKIAAYAQGAYPGPSVDHIRLSGKVQCDADILSNAASLKLTPLSGEAAVVIHSSGGLPGTTYLLSSSTNLCEPFNQWDPLSVGILSGGALNITNVMDPLDKQRFYRFKMY